MKWIALMVRSSFRYGDRDAMLGEVRSIFGNDLIEARLIEDDAMRSSGEYYCFAKIRDYDSHLDSLIESTAVYWVVPCYDSPHEFTEDEVENFGQSVDRAAIPEGFEVGDMVRVNKGDLAGLYGIICDKAEHGRYRAAFRMYTRAFERLIPVEDMEFVDNVFKHVKFPVTMEGIRDGDIHKEGSGMMEALSKIVNFNKIRWKNSRGHKGRKS